MASQEHVDDISRIVIDCGSGSTRAGFCGKDIPSVQMPSIVGYFDIHGQNKVDLCTYIISTLFYCHSLHHPEPLGHRGCRGSYWLHDGTGILDESACGLWLLQTLSLCVSVFVSVCVSVCVSSFGGLLFGK